MPLIDNKIVPDSELTRNSEKGCLVNESAQVYVNLYLPSEFGERSELVENMHKILNPGHDCLKHFQTLSCNELAS